MDRCLGMIWSAWSLLYYTLTFSRKHLPQKRPWKTKQTKVTQSSLAGLCHWPLQNWCDEHASEVIVLAETEATYGPNSIFSAMDTNTNPLTGQDSVKRKQWLFRFLYRVFFILERKIVISPYKTDTIPGKGLPFLPNDPQEAHCPEIFRIFDTQLWNPT